MTALDTLLASNHHDVRVDTHPYRPKRYRLLPGDLPVRGPVTGNRSLSQGEHCLAIQRAAPAGLCKGETLSICWGWRSGHVPGAEER